MCVKITPACRRFVSILLVDSSKAVVFVALEFGKTDKITRKSVVKTDKNAYIGRKIKKRLQQFYDSKEKKALLITGARQVGKTFSIREFGKQFPSFVEINFLENKTARELFENAEDSEAILLRLSVLADKPLIPGETLIFLDEVQECKEIVTAIKFLVEEGSYRYILSGSLLGVDLKDIRSVPVGYMDIVEMYPLDFEEFLLANEVAPRVIEELEKSFSQRMPVPDFVHEKMMEIYRLYLIVGGMPAAVSKYLETNNLQVVIQEQRSIITAYKKDIGKYDPENKLYLEDIFDLIPSELNEKNKRFIMKNLNENFKFSRYRNSFLWLKDAGVALPAFCASEPKALPVEIKSGKDYRKHAALNHVLGNEAYSIKEAYVFHNGNVHTDGKVVYYPVYMLMFMKKEPEPVELIYKLNLDGLK